MAVKVCKAVVILCIIGIISLTSLLLWQRNTPAGENVSINIYEETPVHEEPAVHAEPTIYEEPTVHAEPTIYKEPIVYEEPTVHEEPTIYDEYIPEVAEAPPLRKSPSDLQLALFAHMAFFPFDFNVGKQPGSPQFSSLHYRPFVNYIMMSGAAGQNRYGFNFLAEMEGWYLLSTYYDRATGFSITFYSCLNEDTIILAIRGSDGNVGTALLTQSGTWWCNFRSMAGERHSHINSLVNVLNSPATLSLLDGANIYITGHSLGGYLSYIATYELVRMGFEDNIIRVVAFSAPLLNADTVNLVSGLPPATRSKITHYYVSEDLIAGIVGVDMGSEPPEYGAFELINRLFGTMRDVRSVEIPPAIYTLSTLMAALGDVLQLELPAHMTEIIWRLYGAMGADAMAITNEFRRLVRHETVTHTWHSPPRPTTRSSDVSIGYLLLNHTPELLSEFIADTVASIFDTDTHFMMNFYPPLE
ncbi:MAG: lipase family protein [Firmicutes bacterium]|nr:lipase family protein [Bacillota bacterium]